MSYDSGSSMLHRVRVQHQPSRLSIQHAQASNLSNPLRSGRRLLSMYSSCRRRSCFCGEHIRRSKHWCRYHAGRSVNSAKLYGKADELQQASFSSSSSCSRSLLSCSVSTSSSEKALLQMAKRSNANRSSYWAESLL